MSVVQALICRSVICVMIRAVRRATGSERSPTAFDCTSHETSCTTVVTWLGLRNAFCPWRWCSREFTVPIWTAIIGPSPSASAFTRRVIGIAMGFAGILIIVRPGSDLLDIGAFSVLGAAILYAGTYVYTRLMAATETPFAIIFWMNGIQLLLGLVPALIFWVTPPAATWPWIALIGIAGLTSHWCVAHAMRHADAAIVALDFIACR